MKPLPFIIITTTSDNQAELSDICLQLIEQKLAACCQIMGPQTSIYPWKGQVETSTEWRCEIKTRREHYPHVESLIRQLHHYEVPEIIASEICGGAVDYLNWLMTETEMNTCTPQPSSNFSAASDQSSNP